MDPGRVAPEALLVHGHREERVHRERRQALAPGQPDELDDEQRGHDLGLELAHELHGGPRGPACREQVVDDHDALALPERVRMQLAEHEITLDVNNEAKDFLGERGYDHAYGARPLRRLIQNLIEDPLAEGLLNGRFQPNTVIKVVVQGDDLILEPVEILATV